MQKTKTFTQRLIFAVPLSRPSGIFASAFAFLFWLRRVRVGMRFDKTTNAQASVGPTAMRAIGRILALAQGLWLVLACENYEPTRVSPEKAFFLSPPTAVRIEAGNGSLALTWAFEDTGKVKEFRIYRRDGSDSAKAFQRIAATEVLFYHDERVRNGVTYSYEIAGVNKFGVEGEHSLAIAGTPLNLLPSTTILQEPTTVQGSVSSLHLRWQPTSDTDFKTYQLMRSRSIPVSLSSTLVQVFTNSATSDYTDTGLEPATRYYYRLYVFNQSGKSTGSNIVSGTTPVNDPPAPVALAQPIQNASGLRLTWSQSLDLDFHSYRLYRATASPVDTATTTSSLLIVLNTSLVTEHNDLRVKPNIEYYYRVFVFDRFGLVAGSNEVKGSFKQ
jgi:fibronectin type 3 domain-containing protein